MHELEGKRAAILIADKFQDEEGIEPVQFLREHGAETTYLGVETGLARGKNGRAEVDVTLRISEADPGDFDLLIIPGGAAPETLRLNADVLAFTRAFFDAGKPVAAICHGPQVLISAGVLRGRVATCYAGIRDDVILAGARYVDREAVTDRNLVTSRIPSDVPAFNRAMLALMTGSPAEAAAGNEASD
jgi:protease I